MDHSDVKLNIGTNDERSVTYRERLRFRLVSGIIIHTRSTKDPNYSYPESFVLVTSFNVKSYG